MIEIIWPIKNKNIAKISTHITYDHRVQHNARTQKNSAKISARFVLDVDFSFGKSSVVSSARLQTKLATHSLSRIYLWLIFPNVMQTLKNLADVYLLKNSQHYKLFYMYGNALHTYSIYYVYVYTTIYYIQPISSELFLFLAVGLLLLPLLFYTNCNMVVA